MNYKLHRLAPNSNGWRKPSPGRLGSNGVGSFVKENGFGIEDWNFDFELASNGQMFGYTAAEPAKSLADQVFCVVLATYDAGKWEAVGYYDGAQFKANVKSPPQAALLQMAIDVFELADSGHISASYKGKTLDEITKKIEAEIHHCWLIPKNKVRVFRSQLIISPELFNPGKQRLAVPYNISEETFHKITKLGPTISSSESGDGRTEGARTLELHQRIERNQQLVADFKSSLNVFECTVCRFDFGKAYGKLGQGYIECHHTVPVSDMRTGQTTRIQDLAAVCSNCHRMLHRALPMPTIAQLRKLRNPP